MKTNIRLLTALLLPALAFAAPLAEKTAVRSQPDESAPVLAQLEAGAEPVASSATAPAGWQAVDLPGPHTVFVSDKDVLKNFDVRPGSAYRAQPAADAPVLATAGEGDTCEIVALSGRWLQLKLNRPITGYIRSDAAAAAATPAPAAEPVVNIVIPEAAPAAEPSQTSEPGRAIADDTAELPRMFKGTLVSTRGFLLRRPYDFGLTDSAGVRYAYVDLSRLLQTEQLDKYIGRTVAVFGTAAHIPGSKAIVIKVETLTLQK